MEEQTASNGNKLSPKDKVVNLFTDLALNHPILDKAERVEIKRGNSGHFRLFVATIPGTLDNVLPGLDEIAAASGYTANPYRKGPLVTSISFADNDEPSRKR